MPGQARRSHQFLWEEGVGSAESKKNDGDCVCTGSGPAKPVPEGSDANQDQAILTLPD